MKSLISLLCVLVLVLVVATTGFFALAAEKKTDFVVFGYLPEYRDFKSFNYERAFRSGLTHLIFFSLEVGPQGTMAALDRLPTKATMRKARAAADKYGGKLLLGFGGNARSQNFGSMAVNANFRKKWLDSLEKLLVEYGFDGTDLNWEYPSSDAEWRAWHNLNKEAKQLLDGKCLVTFTIYLDPNHYDLIMRYKILDVADYVLVMAYDSHQQHSTIPFFESGIQKARQYNVPFEKFVNGVPFYGRDVRTGHPETYNDLVKKIVKKWGNKDQQEDPFTLDPEQAGKYDQLGKRSVQYFNSRATIARKTQIAIQKGIAGIMIWEVAQDYLPADDVEYEGKGLMPAIQAASMNEFTQKRLEKGNGDL